MRDAAIADEGTASDDTTRGVSGRSTMLNNAKKSIVRHDHYTNERSNEEKKEEEEEEKKAVARAESTTPRTRRSRDRVARVNMSSVVDRRRR